MRKRKLGLRRDSPQACVSWRSSKWDESWQWEICRTIGTHMTYDYPWSKGSVSLFLFPLLFRLSRSKVSVWKSHALSYQYGDTQNFSPFTFFRLSLRHLFFRWRLFDLPCLIKRKCGEIWPQGELKFPLVHLQINFSLKMNSRVLLWRFTVLCKNLRPNSLLSSDNHDVRYISLFPSDSSFFYPFYFLNIIFSQSKERSLTTFDKHPKASTSSWIISI